jgi:putative transposase
MKFMDEQYTETPFYGRRRMRQALKEAGWLIGQNRVARLMKRMGIEAIYPKPRLSQPADSARRYPYLLKGLKIARPNQVWGADITYVRLLHGFAYLVAIMDWFSRYVLAWSLSVTLDAAFCLEALERALSMAKPDIFNSDQGSQFTCSDFTGRLEAAGVRISRDGRGRVFDNIFNERLWRTVKYEDIYIRDYATVSESRDGLGRYFSFYNRRRFHQSLEYKTPEAIYAAA